MPITPALIKKDANEFTNYNFEERCKSFVLILLFMKMTSFIAVKLLIYEACAGMNEKTSSNERKLELFQARYRNSRCQIHWLLVTRSFLFPLVFFQSKLPFTKEIYKMHKKLMRSQEKPPEE